jgi:hypothetical protein
MASVLPLTRAEAVEALRAMEKKATGYVLQRPGRFLAGDGFPGQLAADLDDPLWRGRVFTARREVRLEEEGGLLLDDREAGAWTVDPEERELATWSRAERRVGAAPPWAGRIVRARVYRLHGRKQLLRFAGWKEIEA